MSRHKLPKVFYLLISFLLIFEQSGFAQVAAQLDISGKLAAFGNSITVERFRPLHLRYLQYNPQDNNFRLLIDKGTLKNPSNTDLERTSKELLKYFFIGLSLPNDKFWVNLRPDAADSIIDDKLAQTDIGRILLEADVQLKKDTANATSPETAQGKLYWDKLYAKAAELFGSQNITIPTLTRPWIVPDEVIIRESTDSAYVYKASLKVMLEQDYLKNSSTYNFKDDRLKALNEYSSQLIRELIIPNLTKEINTSKQYAPLRQVYYSLILAQWFKARNQTKNNPYTNLINSQNLTGFTSKTPYSKETYFNQYQKSFKDGEYNIHTPVTTPTGQVIRSYFSGGMAFGTISPIRTPANNSTEIAQPYEARITLPATEAQQNDNPVFFTPTQATEKINQLAITGDLHKLKAYAEKAIRGEVNQDEYLQGYAQELKIITDILSQTRPVDELNLLVNQFDVKIKQLDILRAITEIILQLENGKEGTSNPQRLKELREVFIKYPEISQLLINYFETRFNPEKTIDARGEEAGQIRLKILKLIEELDGLPEHNILAKAIGILIATIKTDYYIENRTELFLRIDPRAIVAYDDSGALIRTPPYALIWVHVPYGAFGAHSRYADVARGGLRSIRPERVNLWNKVLTECVALSFTQHKKHIDISEGGSKGAFVYQEGLNFVASALAYVDGLTNCMINDERIAVASGNITIDPLELGPDEGTAELVDVITALAWWKNLDTWRLLITGKSAVLGGISHMKNNLTTPAVMGNRVTSQGVMAHAFETTRYSQEKNITPKNKLSLSITGGLDGDVASGLVEIAIRNYNEDVAIRSLVDFSGVMFDPAGLDHSALLEMYANESQAKLFPKEKLGPGGFIAEARKGYAEENYTTLNTDSLKYLNTYALDPQVLEKLGLEAKYKEQAGLNNDQPLIMVLERDSQNRPSKIKVHDVYLRDAMFFLTKADMLITGGGVKDSINDQNWELFFDQEGRPTTPAIVHGANVFTTKNALINLEKKGIFIEPDEKANSVGVEISSNAELNINSIFKPAEITPAIMTAYFKQVLANSLENARWKFFALRIESEDRPEQSAATEVSPTMSMEITALADLISNMFSDIRSGSNPEAIDRLKNNFPELDALDSSYPTTLARLLDRMPQARLQATISKLIAKEIVLNLGMGTVAQLAKNLKVDQKEIVRLYLIEAEKLDIYEKVKAVIENPQNFTPSAQINKLRELRKELTNAIEHSKTALEKEINDAIAPFESGLAPTDKIHIKGLLRKFLIEKYSALKNELILGGTFISAAMLTKKQRQELLGAENYDQIAKDTTNEAAAKDTYVIFDSMDGGLGQSVERKNYLKIREDTESDFKARRDENNKIALGAKGTDLAYDIELNGEHFKASVAEIKLLHILSITQQFGKVTFQPLVNTDSAPSYEALLNSTYLLDKADKNKTDKRTYRQVLAEYGITLDKTNEFLYQANLPIIEYDTNKLTNKFPTPGGHGQWGVMLLSEAKDIELPKDGKTLIRAFYNGDGIANFPDAAILGWMAKKKIGIVMISTTKAGLDKKGGQIGIQILPDGSTRVQMLELAQAKKIGKAHEQLFAAIGLPGVDTVEGVDAQGNPYTYTNEAGAQYFNTNIALINYSVLSPIFKSILEIKTKDIDFEGEKLTGAELLERIVSPDLIENVKTREDGKNYTQLEGAIGSALLNCNAFFSATKDPRIKKILSDVIGDNKLLRIVNVDASQRTKFFTPIKSAFDYWFQNYSDYYKMDTQNWTLVDAREGEEPPQVDIISYKLDKDGKKVDDKFYSDVQNIINSFAKASTIELKSLNIEGQIKAENAILKGNIKIVSSFPGIIDLNSEASRKALNQSGTQPLILNNVSISIDDQGKITMDDTSVKPPSVGSTGEYEIMQEIILEAENDYSASRIAQAAQKIYDGLLSMEEDEFIVNLPTAIKILEATYNPKFAPMLEILNNLDKKDHSGLVEKLKKLNNDSSARTNAGGIDFRTLPIVSQAISNLSTNINRSSINSLAKIDLNNEWLDIEKLINSGIVPSTNRIKEYVQASCAQDKTKNCKDKVINGIADILRQEEDLCQRTNPKLLDILVVLQASRNSNELNQAFLGKAI
ncbi:MAG: NAD-glutamate dehydrogenase domain-containing protein [Candidatus Omnitrophota bacterium]